MLKKQNEFKLMQRPRLEDDSFRALSIAIYPDRCMGLTNDSGSPKRHLLQCGDVLHVWLRIIINKHTMNNVLILIRLIIIDAIAEHVVALHLPLAHLA